jgi:hypothetical protein
MTTTMTSELNQTIQTIESLNSQLRGGHDTTQAKTRLRQIASDAELLLTPVQRGMLNWSAVMKGSTAGTMIKTLEKVKSELELGLTNIMPSTSSEDNWKSQIRFNISYKILQISNSKFKWEVIGDAGGDASVDASVDASGDASGNAGVDASGDAGVDASGDPGVDASGDAKVDVKDNSTTVDHNSYENADAARENAEKFVANLKEGNEKAWITYGVSAWANRKYESGVEKSPTTEIELLQIGTYHYLLICSCGKENQPPTSEIMNQKTIIFTNILMEFDTTQMVHETVTIDLKWLARGVVANSFYVLYKVRNCTSFPNFVQKLKSLFAKADLT